MKYAVVGLGKIGLSHLTSLENAKNCSLSAICDINEEVAKKYGVQYNVPYFTDYKQIPGNCDADAVLLNLPHWLHCEVTEFFLDQGFHVLVEKPMANTPEECRRMIAARDRSGKKLAVAHPQRFIAANHYVKQIVDSGELGELVMMTEFRTIDYFAPGRPNWFKDKKLAGGGITMNYGAHALDRFMYITGSKPKAVFSAYGNKKTEDTIEGHSQFQVIFENGVTAAVTFSGYHNSGFEDLFYFTNGVVKIQSKRVYKYINNEWVNQNINIPPYLQLELEAFEQYVNGFESEIPSAEFGLEVIETIDKIFNG